MKLCSACLLGVKCAYHGRDKRDDRVLRLLEKEILIPVCPEQLGGLTTPRPPQEIQNGSGEKVLEGSCSVKNKDGEDFTEQFVKGAEETLRIAKLYNVKEFIGKARSPSCSSGQIYDGSFSGKLVGGVGVTVALLRKKGIKTISEDDL